MDNLQMPLISAIARPSPCWSRRRHGSYPVVTRGLFCNPPGRVHITMRSRLPALFIEGFLQVYAPIPESKRFNACFLSGLKISLPRCLRVTRGIVTHADF
ncbi:hypothetical protein VTK56DRAFT_9499 [Thermocarpiscus australiensis]